MITLLLTLSLIGQSQADPSANDKITYIDFEDVDIEGQLSGPRLRLIFVRPVSKSDLLIPDVRQLFIDKNGKRVTPSDK